MCEHMLYSNQEKRKRGDSMGRMGRPTDNPKITEIKIRATKEDKEKLMYCCEQTGKTQYQVVMEGLEDAYHCLQKSETAEEE